MVSNTKIAVLIMGFCLYGSSYGMQVLTDQEILDQNPHDTKENLLATIDTIRQEGRLCNMSIEEKQAHRQQYANALQEMQDETARNDRKCCLGWCCIAGIVVLIGNGIQLGVELGSQFGCAYLFTCHDKVD